MVPPAAPGQLRQLIHYHLDNGFYENALFLAGRLHALDPRSAETCHLIALCNLRLGRYKAAYDYAQPKPNQPGHLGCMYVFAQACLALNCHEEGAVALEKVKGQYTGRNHFSKHSDTSRRIIPDAAACFCLLGKLWSGHGDSKKAVDYYIQALKLNPFMWDAFTDLCDLGAYVRPMNIFQVTPEILAAISHSASNGHANGAAQRTHQEAQPNPFVATPEEDPFNPTNRNVGDIGLNLGGSNLMSRLNGMTNGNGGGSSHQDAETPMSNVQNAHDEDVMMGDAGGPVMHQPQPEILHAPTRKPKMQPFHSSEDPPKMRSITSRMKPKTHSEPETTDIPRPIGQNGHKRTVSGHSTHHLQAPAQNSDPTTGPMRRSARILNSMTSQLVRPSSSKSAATSRDPEAKEQRGLRKAKATGTKGKLGSVSQVGRVVSGNRNLKVEISESYGKAESRPTSAAASVAPPPRMALPQPDSGREREALGWLLELLTRLGSGYAHLSRFQCKEAMQSFKQLPIAQQNTPWVLAQVGKAYYELSKYPLAEDAFLKVRDLAPSYTEDMEVFSNVLWQLKKDTDLAYLAHTLTEQDRLSPQAWCALGNAFSLQREHDQAIKCFTRATQLDPKFAYAFTLQGHEHVCNEEYDKAMSAYRLAISADNRHYNGWYGLGQVYEKMGKYDVAEKHYRAAHQLNPTNALLAVKIGSVLDRLKKTQAALVQYISAVNLDPNSHLARFRKAQTHLKLGAPHEALKELLWLKDSASDDANVHFLLGRCYKGLGNKTLSLKHFTEALNLDPKAQMYIKEAMESLDDADADGGWSSEG